jgi:hypothetical protein
MLPFVVMLAMLIILSSLLGRIWVFEYAGLRSQEILQTHLPPVRGKYARIISITADDYRDIFHGLIDSGPLDEAIDRILEFKPAVVVVDLDTSAQRFWKKLKPRPGSVVWARDVEDIPKGNQVELKLLPVRGEMDSSGVSWGLALFPRSLDWTIRIYRRTYRVGSVPYPSLHWEAANRFCNSARAKSAPACGNLKALAQKLTVEANPSEDDLAEPVLHARYAFEPFPLGDLLTKAPASGHSDLVGKIVLLGGSYSPQDRHQMPFGVLDGVEVVANAVEAELNPQGQREIGWVAEVGLKVVLALLIWVGHHFLRPLYALWSSLGLLTLLVFVGSLMAAFYAGYVANFALFLLGILIEQLYHSAKVAEQAVRGEPIKTSGK